MDLQTFQEILISTISRDQETIDNAEGTLNQLKESNYAFFINVEFQSMLQPMNEHIAPISIVHLYREVKSGRLFEFPELALNFLQEFSTNITNLLLSTNLAEQFKLTLSNIFASLHVHIFQLNGNVSIPTYLLATYNQLPQLRKYIINCIYEISIIDHDLGGFSLENLSKILSDSYEDLTLYVPRIHLFFALALGRTELECLHEYFNFLLTSLPPLFLNDFLLSLANFAEEDGYFLSPHAEQLFKLLVEISLNNAQDNKTRNLAIYCFMSLTKGAPEMCKSCPDFLPQIISALFRIVAEIPEDTSWEYSADNDEPYQTALDAILAINNNLDDRNCLKTFYDMNNNLMRDSQVPWQIKFAFISTFTALINAVIIEEPMASVLPTIFQSLSSFLNLETHPRIRVAIYDLMKTTSKYLAIDDNENLIGIISAIEQASLNENFTFGKQMAYQALIGFFSQTYHENSEFVYKTFFIPFFPLVINELHTQSIEVVPYVVKCIGHLAKKSKHFFVPSFQQLTTELMNLLNASTTVALSIEIIYSFNLSLANIDISNNPEAKQICLQFIQASLPLYQNEMNTEEEMEHLTEAITMFINKVGQDVAPIIPSLLPEVMQVSLKDISVEQIDAFEGSYSMMSFYQQIPSVDKSMKSYVQYTDIVEISQSMEILKAIIKCDPNAPEYLEQIINICQHWICNKFFIEAIVLNSWDLLSIILDKYADLESTEQETEPKKVNGIIDVFLYCFINSIDNRCNTYPLFVIVWKMQIALQHAKERGYSNKDLFVSFLNKLPLLINDAINRKQENFKVLSQYNNLDISDKNLSFVDHLLLKINCLIAECYSISIELTVTALANIISGVNSIMQQPELTSFAIDFISNYFIYTRGAELLTIIQFETFLVSTAIAHTPEFCINDLSSTCFEHLGNLLMKFTLEQQLEFADQLIDFFGDFIDGCMNTEKEEYLTLSDHANIAFSKFLDANLGYIQDKKKAIDKFINCMPLWEDTPDSPYYFAFMANTIENGVLKSFNIYWPEIYLLHIINDADNPEKCGEFNLERFAKDIAIELETEEGKAVVGEILAQKPEFQKNFGQLMSYNRPFTT